MVSRLYYSNNPSSGRFIKRKTHNTGQYTAAANEVDDLAVVEKSEDVKEDTDESKYDIAAT